MHHKTCLFTWAAGQDAPGRDFRGAAPNLTLLFPHASEGRRRSLRLAFLPLWQGAQIKLVSHTSLCSPTPQSCFQCWKRERDPIKPALLCVCARAWIPWSSGQVDFVTTLRTGLSTFGFWHFSAGAQTKLVFFFAPAFVLYVKEWGSMWKNKMKHHKTCLFTWTARQDAPGRDFRGAALKLTLCLPFQGPVRAPWPCVFAIVVGSSN